MKRHSLILVSAVMALAAIRCSPLSPSTSKQLSYDANSRGAIAPAGENAVGARTSGSDAVTGPTGTQGRTATRRIRTVVKAGSAYAAALASVQDDYRYVVSEKENVHAFEIFREKGETELELDVSANGPGPAEVVAYVEVIRPRSDCADGLISEACGADLRQFQLELARKDETHWVLKTAPEIKRPLWSVVKTNLVGVVLSFRTRARPVNSRALEALPDGATGVTAPTGAAAPTGVAGPTGTTGPTSSR